ncbi:hypothetical protein K1X84_06170 [bacterium]|nr:hypothetical protein [bacterium]
MATAKVQLGEWITEGWNLLKAQWQTWTAMTIIFFIPVAVVIGIEQAITFRMQKSFGASASLIDFIRSFSQSMTLSILTSFIIAIVNALFLGGIYRAAFKQIRGESIAISDIFSGMDLYVKVVVAALVINVLQLLGTFLCYFPGLIAQGLLMLTIPLIVQKNMEPLDAIKESFHTTKSEWLMFTVLIVVTSLLAAAGVIVCFVGIFFTYPLLFLITAVAYRDIYEPETRPMSRVDELYSKHCRVCHASIPVNAAFCDKCGAGQV